MLLDSFGKDGISTRALLVFLGEDLGEMGVCGFIFIISLAIVFVPKTLLPMSLGFQVPSTKLWKMGAELRVGIFPLRCKPFSPPSLWDGKS